MPELRVTPNVDGPSATHARMGTMGNGTPSTEPSLGVLFRQLAEDSSTLIRKEVALAKLELSQSVSQTMSSAAKVAVWGAVALVGSLVLVTFLVLALGDLLDNYWLSALIVGGLFTGIGAMLAKSNAKQMKEVNLAPQTTMRTLREDKVWAQEQAQELKRDLTAR